MDRFDLKDLTFIIPIRLDTIDRIFNLQMVTECLLDNFETNIHILESGAFNNKILNKLLSDKIQYTFVEDLDDIFYRTYFINKMTKACKTPYIAVWDSDVISRPEQIINALDLLRKNEADFVYPYEFKFLDTSKEISELYFKTKDFSVLEKNKGKMKEMYAPLPVGGAFMARTESYIKSGIENTKFYGWGVEDGERIFRWKVLDYKVKRINGPLYHFTHDRGINSINTIEQSEDKKLLLANVANNSKERLLEEVKTWNKD